MMETVGPIILGCLSLIAAAIFKSLIDWEDLRPGAPLEKREITLFRNLYFAPDFVLLAIGLTFSAKAIGIFDPVLLWWYIICLGATVLLWLWAGNNKRIPFRAIREQVYRDGVLHNETTYVACLRIGITSRSGILTLLFGNLLGLTCPFLFAIEILQMAKV